MNSRGFSLTELLVVAAVGGLVATFALVGGNVMNGVKAQQNKRVVQAVMIELQHAMTKFRQAGGDLTSTTAPVLYNAFKQLDATLVSGPVTFNNGSTHATQSLTCAVVDPNVTPPPPGHYCYRFKNGALMLLYTVDRNFDPALRALMTTVRGAQGRLVGIDPDGVFKPESSSYAVLALVSNEAAVLPLLAKPTNWDTLMLGAPFPTVPYFNQDS
jgi:prepilin-type N-terminal cleavage/methylation domain-containing protein